MSRPAQSGSPSAGAGKSAGAWPLLVFSLLLLVGLLTACAEERSVRIRTSFIELANEELLSSDPNRLDRYNWSIVFEYPDSILDNKNVCYPTLCDTLKENALRVIFGSEAVRRARSGELPPSERLREGDNAFVRDVKVLADEFNGRFKSHYPAARDTLRGDLFYEVDVNGYVASTWQDCVSYHLYMHEDEFGQVHEWERGYNYTLDGRRIYEADLFKAGWEASLSELLTEEFRKDFTTRDIPLLPSRKQDEAARSASPVRPNGNFKFAPGGIIWMYDAGEIAEARYGILRITLPWAELQDLLR
ncbi:MAG: DUF3298 domain-containing protein [Bacteroidales bacterium]|nr:DUF3298 domain-containing protein [Bacteroidales bacterium]MBQ9596687.1 DUF3298 domain-containing protein [Bacteroidales bacterium]